MGKKSVYISLNRVLGLILGGKTCPKSRLEISWKNLEKFHYLISISSSFDFAFPPRKKWKQKNSILQIPKKGESQNFSQFTSRIKIKHFLNSLNSLSLGPAYRHHLRAGYSLFVGRWRDCVLVCLEFVIVWCARYISLILAGAELCTQMFNYLATFHTLCRRFFLLFQIPGELDFFKMRQYFIFQGKTCVLICGLMSDTSFHFVLCQDGATQLGGTEPRTLWAFERLRELEWARVSQRKQE